MDQPDSPPLSSSSASVALTRPPLHIANTTAYVVSLVSVGPIRAVNAFAPVAMVAGFVKSSPIFDEGFPSASVDQRLTEGAPLVGTTVKSSFIVEST